MTRMAAEFFAASPLLALPIFSMLVFLGVFVVVVIRTMRTPTVEIDQAATLPLEEDRHV